MAHAFVTTAFVNAGKLTIRNRGRFKAWSEKQNDGEYLIKVERAKATRSLQANRYWWGVVVEMISEHTGYTPDEVHEWAKCRFLPKRLAFADGNGVVVDELVIGGSTAKMNVNDFYEFVESVRRFAAEHLDLQTPDPDPGYCWEREQERETTRQ